MGSDLIIGLRISIIGLSITFLALGLVILVMVSLMRLFPDKSAAGQKALDRAPIEEEDVDEARLEELAVAIAVGICLLEEGGELEYRDPSLGKLLE